MGHAVDLMTPGDDRRVIRTRIIRRANTIMTVFIYYYINTIFLD